MRIFLHTLLLNLLVVLMAASLTAQQDPVKGLSVDPATRMTIAAGTTIKITEGDLLLKSDDTGDASLIVFGSFEFGQEGQASVQRYFPGSPLDWILLGAPVAEMSIKGSEFEPRHEEGTDNRTDDFYMWHESGWWLNYKTGDGGGFDTYNSGFDFVPGRAYLVAYDFEAGNNPTKTFTGNLNIGNISSTLAYGSAEPVKKGAKSWEYQEGWNLIGNPYTSGIDWNKADRSSFQDDYAYVYSRESNQDGLTEGYTPVNGNEADAFIAPHQGFMVQAKSDADDTSFIFEDIMQAHGGEFTKDQPVANGSLTLRLSKDHYYDETIISCRTNSDFSRDRSDAMKLFSYNVAMPQVYSMTSDGYRTAINAIPDITEGPNIKVGIKTPAQGRYSLALTNMEGVFETKDIYLADLVQDNEILLSNDSLYTFDAQASGDDPGILRFELRFGKDEETGIDDPGSPHNISGSIWNHRNTLYIFSQEKGAIIGVYDINGRKLRTYQAEAGEQSYYMELPAGIYVVRMSRPSSLQTKKIIVR